MTTCPCQWGPSAHCLHGAHDRCRAHIPTAYPATWITDSDGQVWGLNHAQVQVWLADRVCRWICSCGCHATPAAPTPEPVQGVLLFEVGP